MNTYPEQFEPMRGYEMAEDVIEVCERTMFEPKLTDAAYQAMIYSYDLLVRMKNEK